MVIFLKRKKKEKKNYLRVRAHVCKILTVEWEEGILKRHFKKRFTIDIEEIK